MRKFLNIFISSLLITTSYAFASTFNYTWYMSLKKDRRETFMRQPLFITFSANGNRTYIVDGTGKLFSYTMERGIPKAAFFAKSILDKPIAMAKISANKIAVVNRGANEIDIIDLKSRKIEKIKLQIIPDKIFYKNGYFFVLDRLTGNVYMIKNGTFQVEKAFNHGQKEGFIDFKIRRNKLITLLPISKKVKIFNLHTGELQKTIKLDKKQLLLPVSLDIDKEGNIFICDKDAGNIKIYNSEGALLDIILKKGEKKGELYYPTYISFDKQGKLWIAEEGNGRVEVFDKQTFKNKK
ncbi:hypothetical protein [Desulfurobacterium indicum]|uniref:SMP-30/Gluconolactonase/LRE-like region domain-containing protein n=1 Tax=Desulfurobacterium indicum TaxID=1914305 RepID=A0A1R1MKM0_9BACT|nr:hypothetical protein [Desulfurobacterium indicum]OMH40309.1 hypothetical protein BLW93_06030 [Desulfurobacterium indicum]